MKKYPILAIMIIAFIIFAGLSCDNDKNKAGKDEKLKVMVSILPLVEFVEKVGGGNVEVESIIPPGSEPHTYEITPRQLVSIAEADLYVKAGHIEFEESNINKIKEQNQKMKIIDGSGGIELRDLQAHGHDEELKEGDNDHVDEIDTKDPHTWLSPSNAIVYVNNIYQALVELDPDSEDEYFRNKEEYQKELEELDESLKNSLGEVENKKIIVYHPAYGYLLDEYGFEQISVEIEGKEPTAKQLEELINEAKENNIKTIFVQEQFSAKSAQAIAEEIDAVVVKIDPLAKDFVNNLKNISNAITKSK